MLANNFVFIIHTESDTRSSDDQVYAEPIHQLGTPDRTEDAEEREFQNPLYQSSEDITEVSDSKLHSFCRSYWCILLYHSKQ